MPDEPRPKKAPPPSDPYVPAYKGFDPEEATRVLATVDRAKESEGAKGEDANREYVDDGPKEYARRMRRAPEKEENI